MQTSLQEDDKLKTLLHFMKGAEPFSKSLHEITNNREEWCPFTHDDISLDIDCYRAHPGILRLIAYVEKYAACCRYLDCNPFSAQDIERICRDLTIPERMRSIDDFNELIDELKHDVLFVESDISAKLSRITCLECERLDEALECLRNYCLYASVVMAVSAVEVRIVEIIRRHDESLYDSCFNKFTLGQLIQIFDEDHYKEAKYSNLKKLIPAKHKPLIALLNEYRVFSAHPKGEAITMQLSDAIVKLSFAFMIDPTTCPYKEKELECE